jgi:hypothetical protein
MDWADYLRDQAAKYRQLAETAGDLSVKQELLDLAAICEEAANNIEDAWAYNDRSGHFECGAHETGSLRIEGEALTGPLKCLFSAMR